MSKFTQQIFDSILKNKGITINLSGKEPQSGYVVATEGSELKIEVNKLSTDVIDAFILKNLDSLRLEFYFGCWIEGHYAYLDISMVVHGSEGDAIQIGRGEKQIAIYHIDSRKSIKC